MLCELVPDFQARGLRVAFENLPRREPGQRGLEVLARLEHLPEEEYGFVLDTGHANISDELASIRDAAAHRLISLHLNDNDGEHDIHQVPGEGTVDWAFIAELIRRADYHGAIMYEVFPTHRAAGPQQTMRDTVQAHRSLLKSPADAAPRS